MIGQLSGTISFSGDRFIILDVSGVGYKVFVTLDSARQAGKKKGSVPFWIHTTVREDALDLYGFLERAELEFFELLISIPGIGPRSALGIMNIAPVENIKKAVSSGDSAYLTKVSGIGRKTAEKIVLELRDKLGGTANVSMPELKEESDALEALESLGYSAPEAREALKNVSRKTVGTSARVKEALKLLGNGK